MSLSPTYLGDTASASVSPESPREGDFSPQQFYDNLKSLEEHETCDDKRDPIVNNEPDNNSSSLFNAQICASLVTNDLGKVCAGIFPQEQIEKSQWQEPRGSSISSIEDNLFILEVCGLDTRCLTLESTPTQTDWEWVEDSLSFSCQDAVKKKFQDLQLQETSEEYDLPCPGLPRLLAHKPEPKNTPYIKKVSVSKSEKDVHLVHCDYCQKSYQPFTHSEPLENQTHFEKQFCCEQAKKMKEFIQEEREKLAQIEADGKIDVNSHSSIGNEERGAPTLQGRDRLRYLRSRRRPRKGHTEIKHRASYYRLSKEITDEPRIPQKNNKNASGMFTLRELNDGEPKIKELIKKFYRSGTCFLTLCPDGTGNVLQSYPSGKAAIIVSSAEADDFTHIILEDKDTAPSIKGIFTNKGRSTCYHPNGMIWLNLTPDGGLCFSESGVLRRRWNWLYFGRHVRNLPFKPLTLTLGPHISVRINSQEHIYVTFGHQENTVRFSVGSKLKRVGPESHHKPGQGVLELYVRMKKTEIHSLLDQMQTCVSHPSANLHKIKPHYRFTARKQWLSKQMEKAKSPEKKAHAN